LKKGRLLKAAALFIWFHVDLVSVRSGKRAPFCEIGLSKRCEKDKGAFNFPKQFGSLQIELADSVLRSDRTGVIAFSVYDAEEAERLRSGGAKLVGPVGSDVNRIHRSQVKFPISNLYASAAAQPDHDVRVMMAFQAGEAPCLEFKVAHMEFHLLAQVSNQDLARRPAKLAAPMSGELVRLQFDTIPAEARFEPPDDWRVPGSALADTLARHGYASRRWRLCTIGAEGDHHF
jgi:hypothetical protein